MASTEASAPGKIILFGEHAVVYGQPAIAAPVSQVRARATVVDRRRPGILIDLPDVRKRYELAAAKEDDPFAVAVEEVKRAARIKELPGMTITVRSDIPIASGMGSGAATATAVIRALILHLGARHLEDAAIIADLVYQVEKIHHGTPSGIDNTVVAYERPVYFVRHPKGNRIETFRASRPLHLLIADTGISSSTRQVVADVRRQWQADKKRFNDLFKRCGTIATQARHAIEHGKLPQLGDLMNHNHVLLHQMGVSSPELERLVAHAIVGGALGAKLSGGGRGGNMIALVKEPGCKTVSDMLSSGGATQLLATTIVENR